MPVHPQAAPAPELHVSVADEGATRTLAFAGEIDMASCPLVSELVSAALWDADVRSVVIDLAAVTFVDSTGLRTLVHEHERCRRDGIGLAIVPGPAAVQRVFEVCGVLEHLPFTPGRPAVQA
jgi:anti-sigma B factor antagonist